MNRERIITVYGAASATAPRGVLDAAREVGSLLAAEGITVMCGGGATGVMGNVIEGAIEAGGRAVGVLPSFMIERGWAHPGLTERLITGGMHERKETMMRCAEAIIAFPGGIGTLEEVVEAMTWRQLGLWHGRIILLNIDGFYDNLLAQLRVSVERGMMRNDHLELFETATTAEDAVKKALMPDDHGPFSQKIPDNAGSR